MALIVAACPRDPAVLKQRHLETARAYYDKSQYNEAIIELRRAIYAPRKRRSPRRTRRIRSSRLAE
jgi:hypothetical protein